MKQRGWIAASVVALLCQGHPMLARASEQTGLITMLYVRASDGLILVQLDGARTSMPACATQPYFLIKAENTSTGKQQYAQLLASRLSRQLVRIIGGNTCIRWHDGEDIDVVALAD